MCLEDETWLTFFVVDDNKHTTTTSGVLKFTTPNVNTRSIIGGMALSITLSLARKHSLRPVLPAMNKVDKYSCYF